MKRIIFYFLILFASVLIGIEIHQDSGYVLIRYQHWTIETTFWFAIFSLLLAFVLFYFLLRFLRGTSRLATQIRNWRLQRRARKANRLTNRGLCALAEGDWKTAEKDLTRAAEDSDTPLINYLAAASAAQQQGRYEERDSYLRLAHQSTPQAEIAIALTQAQLQLRGKQWELALATLRHLQQIAPQHNYVLQLLKRIYLELRDWKSLQTLLIDLKKRKILKANEYDALEHQVYCELLKNEITMGNSETIETFWAQMPKQFHSDPQILSLYVDALNANKQTDLAESLLREAIRKNWNSDLIERYGLIVTADPSKQLNHAEGWLKTHAHDPALLLCLGRLCNRNRLWGKARSYLESCIQFNPTAAAYFELGQLMEQMGETKTALECYRSGLELG